MKYNVRMFSIKYSKERAKTKKETEEKLQRKMQIAEFEQTPVMNSKISLRNVKRIWRIFTRKKQMD